jgi:D-arabinose 1-dehydrogenase-like Zn-dependent alcohol dehydrogenase
MFCVTDGCMWFDKPTKVSPQIGSCKTCKDCLRGETQLCSKMALNYNAPTGEPSQPIAYGKLLRRVDYQNVSI